LIYLESIFNLSLIPECIPELCRYGLINNLSNFYSLAGDKDIVRISARVLD